MALNDETCPSTSQATASTTGTPPTRVRWYGGALVLFVCFTAYLDRIAFSVSADPMMTALDITTVQFGFITTVFNIGYFISQIPGGLLIQRAGPRRAMTIALLAWSLCTGLTGVANSLVVLAVVRFAFGIGEAPVFTAGNAFFANWFPTRERGRANALMNAGSFFGPAIGPILLVPFIANFGWRTAFFVCAALGGVTTAFWAFFIRDRPAQHRLVNAAELRLTEEESGAAARPGPAPWSAFLRQRSFWTLALAYFGTLWTVQFFIYWLPYYLQKARHVPFESVGTYTGTAFACITVSVLIAGTVSDRLLRSGRTLYQSRNLVAATGLAVAAVCLLMSTTTDDVVLSVIWLSLALGGAGFAQTLAWSIATDLGRSHSPAVGSWMNMWGFVAAAIVPTLAPLIADKFGWASVITVNAAIAVLGIVAFLLTRTNKPLTAAEPLGTFGSPAR
ncbi:MFS transporter [Streptomyces sp. SDT5-1]|uniref:MFS transporter n=1 Tax=Streptomyces sp. SDT5-1 TaxID=3406418 RepID=UPI003FD66323